MGRYRKRGSGSSLLLWASVLVVALGSVSCAPARENKSSSSSTGGSISLRIVRTDGLRFKGSALTGDGKAFELSNDYCYAIHVTGDHPALRRLPAKEGCTDGPPGLGLIKGFQQKGDTIELVVPVGTNRTFDLLAVPRALVPAGDCTAARLNVDPVPGVTPGQGGDTAVTVNGELRNDIGDSVGIVARGHADIVPGDTEVTLVAVSDAPGGKPYDCGGGKSGTVVTVPGQPLTVQARFANAPSWNDWVTPSDAPCDVSTAGPQGCLHGGEHRRVSVPAATNCVGLYLEDQLRAFQWNCRLDADGTAYFESELAPGRGALRDLIGMADAATPVWLPNKVTLYQQGNFISESVATVWWQNPLAVLPASAGPGAVTLDEPGKIYVLPTDRVDSYGYNVNADRVALVGLKTSGGIPARLAMHSDLATVANNCDLTGEVGGEQRCFLAAGTQKHLWIELDLSTTSSVARLGTGGGVQGVYLRDVRFSRLNQMRVAGFANGVFARNADVSGLARVAGLTFNQVTLVNNGMSGLRLESADGNVLRGIAASNNGEKTSVYSGAGLVLQNSSRNLVAGVNASGNGTAGVMVTSEDSSKLSAHNAFTQLTLNNNGGYGIALQAPATLGIDTTVLNAAAMGNGAGAFKFAYVTGVDLVQAAALSNAQGLVVNEAAIGVYGTFVNGGNSTNCQASTGATATNVDLTNCQRSTITGSDLALDMRVPTTTILSPFVGKVGTAISWTTGMDWLNAATLYGGLGRQGTPPFPQPSQLAGPCLSSQCINYDWRLKSADPLLLNRTQKGLADGVVNAAFPLDYGACPASLATTLTINNKSVYLLATEDPSGSGNRNGYCEAGERCLYTPNFGVYQGGNATDTSTRSCRIGNGPGSTELIGYAANGVAG